MAISLYPALAPLVTKLARSEDPQLMTLRLLKLTGVDSQVRSAQPGETTVRSSACDNRLLRQLRWRHEPSTRTTKIDGTQARNFTLLTINAHPFACAMLPGRSWFFPESIGFCRLPFATVSAKMTVVLRSPALALPP